MVLNDDQPDTTPGDSSLFAGQRKWALGVGVVVLVVALLGLGVSSVLDGTGLLPVLAIAIAVLGGAGITLWLIDA